MAKRQYGTIRRLASGRWQARYRDPLTGRQVAGPNTFGTRGDASRWLARLEAGLLDVGPVQTQKSDVRFAEYAERWVAHRNLRPRTAELYRLQLRLHINPCLGEARVAKLQPSDIREWHSALSKGHLHPVTVAKIYRLLRSILTTAVEDGLVDANPCRIKNGGAESSKERPIPTVDQVRQLADAMPAHLSATVWVAALCGLRKGEILGLARKHIELEGSTTESSGRYRKSPDKVRSSSAQDPQQQPVGADAGSAGGYDEGASRCSRRR